GADALGDQAFRITLCEAHAGYIVGAPCARAHRDPAHGFDAGGDHHVVSTGDHSLCREMHGLLAAAALPVDRGGGYRFRETGCEGGPAGHIHALLSDLADDPADHVVDQCGI